MKNTALRKRLMLALATASLVTTSAYAQSYSLTILHNNDGESQLLQDNGFGGVARFKTLVDQTRSHYRSLDHGVLTLYAGDSFQPSPEFQASLNSGAPGNRTFYDALALSQIGYDAAVIGNHEFDAGPGVLAEFIGDAQTTNPIPYLSANLDFTNEPALNPLVGTSILPSTTITVSTAAGEKKVGVIGATTENLPFLSSTGGVTVSDVANAVNAQIASLKSQSVDHIILVSHLQGINEDLALIPNLDAGIDAIVAGGGDEILADLSAPSPTTVNGPAAPSSVVDTGLVTGDTLNQAAYPNPGVQDKGGNLVPIVTSGPNYQYLGRLTLNFDDTGNLTGFDASSNPQIVTGDITPDPTVLATTTDPVQQFVDSLQTTVIAQSSQLLAGNGNRDIIRAKEAGLGNLVADAFMSYAEDNASEFNVDMPDFAVANGGGIRDDIDAGTVTLGTTFDISPFGNIISVIEDVERQDIKRIFENAYSRTVDGDEGLGVDPTRGNVGGTGRFLHVSEGVQVVYDITKQALELDNDGNIVAEGSRIIDLIINGEEIVKDGQVIAGDALDMAIVDFLANGGDQTINANYLSKDYAFTRLGATDQTALQEYLELLADGDQNFDITSDSRYDNTQDGRITAIPEPTSILPILAVTALLATRRKQG